MRSARRQAASTLILAIIFGDPTRQMAIVARIVSREAGESEPRTSWTRRPLPSRILLPTRDVASSPLRRDAVRLEVLRMRYFVPADDSGVRIHAEDGATLDGAVEINDAVFPPEELKRRERGCLRSGDLRGIGGPGRNDEGRGGVHTIVMVSSRRRDGCRRGRACRRRCLAWRHHGDVERRKWCRRGGPRRGCGERVRRQRRRRWLAAWL